MSYLDKVIHGMFLSIRVSKNPRLLFLPAAIMLVLSSGCAGLPGTREYWKGEVSQKRRQRSEEATRHFENNRDRAQFEAARTRWEESDLKGCREGLERLLSRNPRHLEARLLLAEVNLLEKRHQAALEQVDEVLRAHPDHARALYIKGLVLDAIGQFDGALAYYKQAARAEPENQEYSLCCQTAKESDDYGEAMSNGESPAVVRASAIEDVEDKRASLPEGKQGPVLALPAPQPPPVKTTSAAATKWKSSVARSRDVDFSDSFAHAESAVSAEEFLAAGQRALRADAVGAARIAYQKAAASQPNNPQIPISAAAAAIRANHPELAVELLAPAARHFSKSAAIYRLLGVAHYRTGDYKSSQVALQQALLLDKSSALSYFLMGCTLAKLGQAESAEAHFKQACALDARYTIRR
jgi:tetratricopeptide (TPR) repeat protein